MKKSTTLIISYLQYLNNFTKRANNSPKTKTQKSAERINADIFFLKFWKNYFTRNQFSKLRKFGKFISLHKMAKKSFDCIKRFVGNVVEFVVEGMRNDLFGLFNGQFRLGLLHSALKQISRLAVGKNANLMRCQRSKHKKIVSWKVESDIFIYAIVQSVAAAATMWYPFVPKAHKSLTKKFLALHICTNKYCILYSTLQLAMFTCKLQRMNKPKE
jgi:hypothetical protein